MYKAIAANKRNTILIMVLFIGVFSMIGWAVGLYYEDYGMAILFMVGAIIYALFQYFMASKLAVAMAGAHQIEKKDNPRLYRIVENLAITTGLPTPKVYIIDDPSPNAFATGRDPQHAIVAATTGMLSVMDDNELEAVMAHEMGHVANYDIRLSMIIFGLVSAVSLLTNVTIRVMSRGNDRNNSSPIAMAVGLIVMALAPLAAVIIQMAVSRQREYLADATSALTTRHPEGLASALEKLRQNKQPMQKQNTALAHLFITNPLKAGVMSKMFSTHPPLEERITRLRNNVSQL